MSALGGIVRAGVGRRRVQTAVMVLTTMLAVMAGVLSTGLIDASRSPFDRAFEKHRGAHLTARFDGAKVTQAQTGSTAQVAGVTAASGPFPALDVRVTQPGAPPGNGPEITVVGRPQGGGLELLDLKEGRWPAGAGEAVVNGDRMPFRVGSRIRVGGAELRIVGRTGAAAGADLWTLPEGVAALAPAGTVPDRQMLYRFADAGTDAAITRARTAIAAAVPAGGMTEGESYLTAKKEADRTAATFVPFVVAFAVLALCMSVLTIVVVVGGAVGAATRRIGILKAVGFTPAQVVRAYTAQALIPALVGTAAGTVLGNLLAVPVLIDEGTVYGSAPTSLAPWVSVAVPGAALVVVGVAALVPALRAGRLRAVEALAVGRTPRAGRGRRVQWLLGRLPVPRPVSLGLAAAVARPARAATMLAAVLLGTVGVTFGAGLALSLTDIQNQLSRQDPGDAVVLLFGRPEPGAPPKQADPAKVAAVLRAQPGTAAFLRMDETTVSVGGLAGRITVRTYDGDSSWAAQAMISGRWFRGEGEAVAPTGFLTSTGTRIGDTVTLSAGGRESKVVIVGEAMSLREEGMSLFADASSLAGLSGGRGPGPGPEFDVLLAPGTDGSAYLSSLNAALGPLGAFAVPRDGEGSSTIIAMDALTGTFVLLLITVAGLGVFNTVVLDTRDRVHDLGVMKAVGMSPRQTVTMVMTSIAVIGIAAGALGVPAGILLHDRIMPIMGEAAGTRLPHSSTAVFHAANVLPLLCGGLLIAVAGAILPAGWAAGTRTAAALRAE